MTLVSTASLRSLIRTVTLGREDWSAQFIAFVSVAVNQTAVCCQHAIIIIIRCSLYDVGTDDVTEIL